MTFKKKNSIEPAELHEAVIELFERPDLNMTDNQIRDSLNMRPKPDKPALVQLLQTMVDRGDLFIWQPQSNLTYYCQSAPRTIIEETVFSALKKRPHTAGELKQKLTKLKKISIKYMEGFLKPYLEKKHLFYHPPLNRTQKPRYSLQPVEPGPYLEKLVNEFNILAGKMAPAGFSSQDILAALCRSLDLQIPPTAESLEPPPPVETKEPEIPATPVPEQEEIERLIVQAMEIVEPRAREKALVSIREVRSHIQQSVPVPKTEFDRAMIALAKKRTVILHFHDYPARLSQEERDELVLDSQGNYYLGVVFKE